MSVLKSLRTWNTALRQNRPQLPEPGWTTTGGNSGCLSITSGSFPKGQSLSKSQPIFREILAETVQANKPQVDAAVSAARQAYISWSQTPGITRARYLYAIARNIQKHQRLLAVVESRIMVNQSVNHAISTYRCWRAISLPCRLGAAL